MDMPAQTDESSRQLMLIAQREETKKIFEVPAGSFLEEIIERGEEFENNDPTVDKPDPYTIHQRIFKVKNLLGEDERTVIVDTLKKDGLTKTTFSLVKMTADKRAANRLDISYSQYSDGKPSVVSVYAAPSGQLHGVAFDLDSQNKIGVIDDISRSRGAVPVDLEKAPSEFKLFDGMKIDGLKVEPNSLAFNIDKFPYPQSQPTQITIPRVLGRQSVTS